MKITNVTPWIVTGPSESGEAPRPRREGYQANQYNFVQVETDEGITGWGEITTYPGVTANHVVAAFIREAKPILIGEDPRNVEALWHKVFRHFTYLGTRGATCAILSGVDIALWDIKGKALGVPVYELLGGKVRELVPLYTHIRHRGTIESAIEGAREQVAGGSRAIKTDPFLPWFFERHTAYLDGQIAIEHEEKGIEMIAGIREAVGSSVEVLIDAHAMFNVPTAIRLATRLAPFNITWFEEPVPPESYHALAQVRDQVPVRICVGERLHTRFDFLPVFERHLADYVMPDVTWTGGISELKKIATLAETFYIPLTPHDASGPVNILAGAHVSLTVPNFYRLEARRIKLDFYNAFLEEPLVVEGDTLRVSDRPGLGITFNMDYMRANSVESG